MTAPAATARSQAGLPVAVAVALLLVAFSPAVAAIYFTPKAAVLLVLGAIGVPLLVTLALGRDAAAVAGVAFAVWAVISALVARSALAWTGLLNLGTGAVFMACLTGVWALGRFLSADARRFLRGGALVGILVNATIAILQGPFDLSRFDIRLFEERSTGLTGNPVFLGALCAAGVALLLPALERRLIPALVAAAAMAAAVQLSGSRVALALLAVPVLALVTRRRWVTAALLAAAVGVGVVSGSLLAADRTQTGAVSRAADPGGGLSSRTENWREALHAVAERPVLGWGPGRFRAAVTPHRTLRLAKMSGPDRLYWDAHNIFVEHAVTTGVVGLALLAIWFALAAWTARRGPNPEFLLAAGVLLVFHLVEPENVAVTPFMLLLGGAAAPLLATPARPRTGLRTAGALAAAVALVLAGRLVAGDALLEKARLDFDAAGAHRAGGLLWPWAAPAVLASRVAQFEARAERRPGRLVDALHDERTAARREPDDPRRWVELASVQSRLGDHRAALASTARSLEIDPWSRGAFLARADELAALGRLDAAAACRRLARVTQPGTRIGSGLGRSRSDCLG